MGISLKHLGSLVNQLLSAADAAQQRRTWLAFPVAVVKKTSNDQGGTFAALVAYFGFLSVFPLLLVFASVLGFLLAGDPHLQAEILHRAERSFPALSGYISTTLSGSEAALGIGIAGALWAGLGVTRAVERAMNSVWDIPMDQRPNLWWSRLRGLSMLLILGSTILVSTALAGLPSATGALAVPLFALAVGGPLVLNLVLYVLAFKVLTNTHLSTRELLPGAAVGAVGWTALQRLGAFYTRHEVAHASQLYGSLATVIGILAWIYLGAQLTIYAAEVNVVTRYRLWPRSLRGVHTDADRRSLVRQAREAQRSGMEQITVAFTGDVAASRRVAPQKAAPQGAAPQDAASPGTTGDGSSVGEGARLLAGQLEELHQYRSLAQGSAEAAQREAIAERIRAQAGRAAQTVHRLAQQEPEFAAALADLLR